MMELSVAGTSQEDGSLLPPGSVVTLPIITGEAITSSSNGTTTIINVPIIRDGTFLNATAIPTSQGLVIATGPDGTGTMFLDPSQVAVITQDAQDAASFVPIENAELGESGQEPACNYRKLRTLLQKGRSRAANDILEIKPPVGRGPFLCETCDKSFPKWSQLQRHVRTHADDKPHRCDECHLSFNVEKNLVLHKATHNMDDPTCPECMKKFSRVASLKAHIMMHEHEEIILCEECGDEFGTQSQLEKHWKQHLHEELELKVHTCKKCSFQFPKASLLREHMKVHYRIKVSLSHRNYKRNIDRSAFAHKCHSCGKTFQKPSQLKRHARIHTGERPFACDQCDKSFNQKGALQIHMSKHSGVKPHRCEFCPAAFSQKGNLRAHIQRVHIIGRDSGPDQMVYCCEECTCVFKKLGSLNAHVSRMHADEGEFPSLNKGDGANGKTVKDVIKQLMFLSGNSQSNEGGNDALQAQQSSEDLLASNSDLLQQALQNSGLTSNQTNTGTTGAGIASSILRTTLIHGGKKESEAEQTGESATGPLETPNDGTQDKSRINEHSSSVISYMLKKHPVRKVGGVRWHQCLECSKEFKKPSDLIRHIRIHTHEKPYKCLQCFRSFAVKSTLTAHCRTHTGIKMYKCHVCNKPFATHGSLNVHLRLHTGARPFDCPHCDKRFRTSGHRKSHLVSHLKDGDSKKIRRITKRATRSSSTLPDVPLQEPILITDNGLVQNLPAFSQFTGESAGPDRPYKCTCCTRAFKKSSHLKQHIRSHTGEKPYRCLICNRRFVSGGVLKAHMRTHSGVKPYRCQQCNSSFTTNGSLKRHTSIHSEVRPFMCPYCQKTFKTSVNCKKHMKTHKHELALQAAASNGAAPSLTNSIVEPILNSQFDASASEVENLQVDESDADGEHTEMAASLEPQNITLSGTFAQLQHTLDQHVFNDHNSLTDNDLGHKVLQVHNGTPFDQEAYAQQTFEQFTAGGFTLPADHITHTLDISTLTNSFSQNNSNLISTNISNILSTQDTGCQTLQDDLDASSDENQVHEAEEEKPGKRNYKCTFCVKGFKKSSHLKQHIRTHTGEKPYKCTQCNRMFASMGVLKAHLRTHSGVKDYKCQICQAAFTTNGSLTRHKLIHNNARRPFKCPNCPQTFRSSVHYQRHFKMHAPAPVENVGVEETEALDGRKTKNTFLQFSEEQTVKLAKQPPEECSTISEKILIASAAEKNRVSEIKDKQLEILKMPKFPHMCRLCPKSFKKPSDLVRHTRIHTGEKPYTCELCNKCFTVKSTLDSHMKTHTGQKQFNCHVCGSMFATKGSLKVHMRLHTGAKPFKCPHCEKRFRTSGHRKSHIVTHFKSVPLQTKKRRQRVRSENEVSLEEEVDQKQPSDPITTDDDMEQQQMMMTDQSLLQAELLNGVQTEGVLANITLSLDGLTAEEQEGMQIAGLNSGMIAQTIQIDANLLQQLQQQGNINITINGILPPGLTLDGTGNNAMVSGASTMTTDTIGNDANIIIQPMNITFPMTAQSQVLIPVEQENGESGYQLTLETQGQRIEDTSAMVNEDMDQSSQELTETKLMTESTEVNLNITESGEMVTKVQVLEKPEDEPCDEENRTGRGKRRNCACEVCHKVFKRWGSLKEHVRTVHQVKNTMEKSKMLPYFCTTCDKQFMKPSQLERHMRIHTGERPFECPICNKTFNQKNAMQTHMNRHTGERPYKCPYCQLRFTQKGNLNVHVRRVHAGGEGENLAELNAEILDGLDNIVVEVHHPREQDEEDENNVDEMTAVDPQSLVSIRMFSS